MQTLQVEGSTHQAPCASGGLQATQRALAEAHDVFENAQHRFDGPLAQAGDRTANRGWEFVGHLDLRTGIRWRWRELLHTIRLPTEMMGYPPRGNVRRNVPRFHGRDVGGAEGTMVQGTSLR